MRKITSTAFAVILAAATTNAVAASPSADSGNFWFRSCNEDASMCMAFVMGLVEGSNFHSRYTKTKEFYCAPSSVTYGQYADIFKKFLKDHPESRHESAVSIAMASWSIAFPCK